MSDLQPTVNIGTIGHVSHGKSTLVRGITGVRTQKRKAEQARNITIDLGYANAKIFWCPETDFICSAPSHVMEMKHPKTGTPLQLVKHVSFVDCPGHEAFMSTMIGGTSVMDAAFLLVAGNEEQVPQPQTYEHLLAISNTDLSNILVLQNKLDLITEEKCQENLDKIKAFLNGSPAQDSPIIPISAQKKENLDAVLRYIAFNIPEPERNTEEAPLLTIIRSFDINKPGTRTRDLQGGVAGGSLKTGVLRKGDLVEIRPGITEKDEDGKLVCKPLFSRVESLHSEKNVLESARPGGLIGVGLSLDPALTRANRLVGQTLGRIGTLPPVWTELIIKYKLMRRNEGGVAVKVKEKIRENEKVLVSVNSSVIRGLVLEVEKKQIRVLLQYPACVGEGTKLALLRERTGKWRLEAFGTAVGGKEIQMSRSLPTEAESSKKSHGASAIEFSEKPVEESADSQLMPTHVQQPIDSDYDELLKNVRLKQTTRVKIKVPPPQVLPYNRECIFTNFQQCANSLDFSSSSSTFLIPRTKHLFGFLVDELGVNCSINGENQMVISRRFKPGQIQGVLVRYIKRFMVCPTCKANESYMFRRNGLTWIHCLACSAETSI